MKPAANPISAAGIAELSALYESRAITPLEAFESYLSRIERLNPALNALVHLDTENARKAARAAAHRWAKRQPKSAIDGAVIAVKANIAVAGLPHTSAVRAYSARIAADDGAVVAKLREAGAVIIGVANMHEAAFGATNESALYGRAFNPLAAGFTPGGSSGGSAAAVAAGFCTAALGSDTMGSVRIPSAYCGVVGLKPTFGRLSRRGLDLLSWTLDTVGVHGKTAADCAALLAVVQGEDRADPFSQRARAAGAVKPLSSLKLGRVRVEAQVAVEPKIEAALDLAFAELAARGARIVDIEIDAYDFARARRAGLLVIEAEGAVSLSGALKEEGGVSAHLRTLFAFAERQSAVKLASAYALLQAARRAALAALLRVDALLLPTAAQRAFRHGDPIPDNQADLTALANFAGLPAAAAPVPVWKDELPASLQVITAPWKEALALKIAGEAAAAFN